MKGVLQATVQLMRRLMKLADTRSSGRKTEILDRPKCRDFVLEELLLDLGQPLPEMDSVLTVDVVGGDVELEPHPVL